MKILNLSIDSLHNQYKAGDLTPADMLNYVLERCNAYHDYNIWLTILTRAEMDAYLTNLAGHTPDTLPLYGIPFAIKDNIDLAGVPTTAACPEFSYVPEHSAFVVQLLINAGAIPIGKTNLDQFATGLVGTRSPYGAVKNSCKPEYISGGSSSGSAVATALGLVSFALGTDTAGSGRVPAMFNNLIGLKPSCGILSTRGVVPACRTIDCVSIMALNPDDTERVYTVTAIYDENDSFARQAENNGITASPEIRFGIISDETIRKTAGPEVCKLMHDFTAKLVKLGWIPVEIDYTPFENAASLLYEGPWIAERYIAIEDLIKNNPDALFPITREIINGAEKFDAVDAFKASYSLKDLKRQADRELSRVNFILTPTAPAIYTIQQVLEQPIKLNNHLGSYTNFMNLLDYAAIAIPAGSFSNGLPFGVTLFAGMGTDRSLIDLSRKILAIAPLETGAVRALWLDADSTKAKHNFNSDNGWINLSVCGAHLSGMPLNHQLTELEARFVCATRTSANYNLYCLPGGPPYRPGLVKDMQDGVHIELEVWSIPESNLGIFLKTIPSPLGLGKVELVDGSEVIGFICEPYIISSSEDITKFGGWINYLKSKGDG